jgi:hypothetical protein
MQNNAVNDNNNFHRKVQDGLDFILNHFQEPKFPRKIMTKKLGLSTIVPVSLISVPPGTVVPVISFSVLLIIFLNTRENVRGSEVLLALV